MPGIALRNAPKRWIRWLSRAGTVVHPYRWCRRRDWRAHMRPSCVHIQLNAGTVRVRVDTAVRPGRTWYLAMSEPRGLSPLHW